MLRVVMGINMFTHGAVRLFGDYSGFVGWVEKTFSGTILPGILVTGVGWAIPPIEFVIGILLVTGTLTFSALLASGGLMSVLVFGMCLKQNWGTVADQMIYTGLFSALLFGLRFNECSVDGLLMKKYED
ncbi:MAG: MauE/DoxX family redox-associated membrane protein [bacterium]